MKRKYEQLLEDALGELISAVGELVKPTYPETPLPRRARVFRIESFTWPCYQVIDNESLLWGMMSHSLPTGYFALRGSVGGRPSASLVAMLLKQCGYQPARVLHAAKQIRAAAEWCRRRAAGRRRHAEEILRQQWKAAEEIDADIALIALSKP